ncbi:hypothetical protein B6259_01610 [Ruminococcaceae bacterium CPB6]|nr:hypothetical protein B6259_01610 [Ruminococcaceae bacterium CPB6]
MHTDVEIINILFSSKNVQNGPFQYKNGPYAGRARRFACHSICWSKTGASSGLLQSAASCRQTA